MIISTSRLKLSRVLHLTPIKVVVYNRSRNLILWPASRLYAFSGYPNPTWLPSSALDRTTGTPEVGPPRSSRTRGRPTQISTPTVD